jgi:antitoxin CptB
MKELDELLTRYVDERFAAAPLQERQAFEALLDVQDPVIYAYCLGQLPVPAHFKSLIPLITAARVHAGGQANRADC